MDRSAILVVGSANMDMVVVAAKFPKPGETIFGRQFSMYPGGKGANQAVCAAKLGGVTHFIGRMGDDLFREQLVQNMSRDGVVMDHLFIDPEEPTGIALITVDGRGENEIIVISGSNMKLTPANIESRSTLFSRAGVVLAQLEIPLATVEKTAELAKASGAIFILNPAPAQTLPAGLLQQVDFLTPNRLELELLSGETIADDMESIRRAAQRLLNKGVGNVLVTLGERGALWITAREARLFASHRVTAVDTTAAGDAFNGAFALALSRGAEVPQAIHFANRVAAFAVTRMGAQCSMPTAAELEGWR